MVSDELLESMKKKVGDADSAPIGYNHSGASSISYSNGPMDISIAQNYEHIYFGMNMSRNYSVSYAPSIARNYEKDKLERRKVYNIQ